MRLQNSIELREPFSLAQTLECGQIFRVFKRNDYYIVPYKGSVLKLAQKRNMLFYKVFGKEVRKTELGNFLGITHSISEINQYLLSRDERISPFLDYAKGLRIIKMEPYEAAISFIFSIQSSIKLISRRLNVLSEIAGKPVKVGDEVIFLFPTSKELGKLSNRDITLLRLGFRERFFREFIEKYSEKDFEKIASKSFEEKEKFLLSIMGVGEKVAHCILLFGFGELSAFPVDVWIKRGLECYFGISGSSRKLTEEGRAIFGKFSGYAQEYMFAYIRVFNS
jgi:N-glycosylase/DNA lyase